MTSYTEIEDRLAPLGLTLLGGFYPEKEELGHVRTLLLIGANPKTFWPCVKKSNEASLEDPVDSYSRRTIGQLACALIGKAYFPFGQRPAPFISWALRSGLAHLSPTVFLVHNRQGLMVSYRGALALRDRVNLPLAQPSPCLTCDEKPCLTTCPVNALENGYDLKACRSELDRAGNSCAPKGCAVRRACPLSQARPDAQSAHHMSHLSF